VYCRVVRSLETEEDLEKLFRKIERKKKGITESGSLEAEGDLGKL
jgi:hypothetical protein